MVYMATNVTCTFIAVNGQNTGMRCKSSPSVSSSAPSGSTNGGILMLKHCPNGTFVVDTSDGDGSKYYRLVDHQKYGPFKNVPASEKVYVYVGQVKDGKSSFISMDDGSSSTTTTSTTSTSTTSTQDSSTDDPNTENVASTGNADELDSAITNMLQANQSLDSINEGIRVIGAPFQFLSATDYRPFGESPPNGIGRKYMENILAEAPLVYFVPGHPNFMPEIDESNREVIKNYIEERNASKDIGDEAMQKILSTEGRYFDFIGNYAEYMKYVNMLCRACAIYIGIGDRTVPGTTTPYKTYDWSKYVNYKQDTDAEKQKEKRGIFDAVDDVLNNVVDDIMGDYQYLKVYVDPNSSFNESLSNSTTTSQLEGLFDQVSGLMREAQFLTSGSSGSSILSDSWISDMTAGLTSGVSKVADAFSPNSTNNIEKLLGLGTHILQGSSILFPEMWADSSYSKSYSFTVNLVSPYGDAESIYLNIIVPMMHFAALAFPRQQTANSFISPFLVKIFAKGWFSCDLGLVESITFEKAGGGDAWNVLGLPSEVKVSLQVKDLYTNLMISKSTKPWMFFTNQGLMDFLQVTCGVDITNPNVTMKIQTILSTYLASMFDIPSNVYDKFVEGVRNKLQSSSMFGFF